MKDIKQIRKNFDLITEKEEKESQKLSALVRAGLYDAKKLPALKKALDKSADKMTGQEKRMLLNLLDSLISQVTSDEQVYRKVRQNVHSMNEAKEDYLSKFDPRFKPGYPSDKDIPTVLILKRKAIRVYPDNQKVALYYSQALDKYVTIPFSEIQTGINEAVKDDEKEKKAVVLRRIGPKAKIVRKAINAAHLVSKTGKKYSPPVTKQFSDLRKEVGTVGGALGVLANRGIKRAITKTRLSIRKKNRSSAAPTQVNENILGAALKLGARAATGIGSKLLGKFKSARGVAGKIGKGSGKKTRTAGRVGRLARGAATVAAGAGALAGAAAAGAAGSQGQSSQSTQRNYGLGQLKPTSVSSREYASDTRKTQDVRDTQLNRRSQTAMMKENTNVFSLLKEMVNNDIKEQTVSFNEQEININNTVAKKIMLVYESVNNTNKKKIEKMLNESAASFNKVLTFALRQ